MLILDGENAQDNQFKNTQKHLHLNTTVYPCKDRIGITSRLKIVHHISFSIAKALFTQFAFWTSKLIFGQKLLARLTVQWSLKLPLLQQ